jgi:hypothetical protein
MERVQQYCTAGSSQPCDKYRPGDSDTRITPSGHFFQIKYSLTYESRAQHYAVK